MTDELLLFEDREAFRAWLQDHVAAPGVWLVFGKAGGPKTLTAGQALEEALCFGWIDGQMESLDSGRYRKYFAPRRPRSKWSEKNRKLAEILESQGKMTEYGRGKIDEAKRNGTFEGEPGEVVSDLQVDALKGALRPFETALANFEGLTPSARRAYTGAYFAAKTEAGREKLLGRLVERLNLNANPMESLRKKKAETEGK